MNRSSLFGEKKQERDLTNRYFIHVYHKLLYQLEAAWKKIQKLSNRQAELTFVIRKLMAKNRELEIQLSSCVKEKGLGLTVKM